MEKEFLNLVPESFLCPFCGEWHEWPFTKELGYFDDYFSYVASLPCRGLGLQYEFYFSDGYLYYSAEQICRHADIELDNNILISSIIEDDDEPIVTFDVTISRHKSVEWTTCYKCNARSSCIISPLGDKGNHHDITLKFGFRFNELEYKSIHLKSKECKLRERENALKIKEQSLQNLESDLKVKEQELKQQHVKKSKQANKEDTTMANNLFNINTAFGPNKDENIASTIMGIAVKNEESWRIYDKKKKEITDIGDMQLGNLPIFIMPTTKLTEGDLIKDNGEYFSLY